MTALLLIPQRYEFSSKSQQSWCDVDNALCCCWYHKGTNFQANHNDPYIGSNVDEVVADTTKVRIFKQITTVHSAVLYPPLLLLIPQRYEFSSKSQPANVDKPASNGCCWYHKGTNFQANHNMLALVILTPIVVADTTKVRIFKQITTVVNCRCNFY